MTNEVRPMKHADHPEIERLRCEFRYQVEIKNVKEHIPRIPPWHVVAQTHFVDATWSDVHGDCTFAFSSRERAALFTLEYGGEVVEYRPEPAVDETVEAPEPPPHEVALEGPASRDEEEPEVFPEANPPRRTAGKRDDDMDAQNPRW